MYFVKPLKKLKTNTILKKKKTLQFKNITVGFKMLTGDQEDKIEEISQNEKQNVRELEEGKITSRKE